MSENSSEITQPQVRPPKAAPPVHKRILSSVWSFLSSIKLAVVLLILLALISIIGTILAQGESHQDNIQFFTNSTWNFFTRLKLVDVASPDSVAHYQQKAREWGVGLYNFSRKTRLDNLYHTWYFNMLLLFLAVNLIICTIRRWPHTWRFFSKPKEVLEGEGAAGIPLKSRLNTGLGLEEAGNRASEALKSRGYKAKVIRRDDSFNLFAQKGIWGRFGVYITHLSLLVIGLGSWIGLTYGFKGFVGIEEGQTVNTIQLRMGQGDKELGFALRCDDFELTYYPGTNRPQDYKSALTVIENGQEVKTKTIEVNDPLIYPPSLFHLKSIFFYQSSYGDTGKAGRMKVTVTSRDGTKSKTYTIPLRGVTDMEEFGLKMKVESFLPDFAMNDQNKPFSKSRQPNNPAALVALVLPDGNTQRTWLFKNFPDFHGLKEVDFSLRFADYESQQYTGLQVAYDPGVWVVWLGCTLMVIGVFVAFFLPHRRMWVKIVPGEEKDFTAWVAGSTSKNRAAFEIEFGETVKRVKESLAS